MPDGLVSAMTERSRKSLVNINLNSGKSKSTNTLESDRNILCQKCDSHLGLYDEELVKYVKRWQSSPVRYQKIDMSGPPPTEKIKCNSNKLLLSLLTILLRFSYSDRYENVSLGSYEKTFATWLRTGVLPENFEQCFSAIAFGYAVEEAQGQKDTDLSRTMKALPVGGRVDGAFIYFFELPSVFFLARVGKTRWSHEANYPPILKNKDEIKVPCLDFTHTSLFKDEMLRAPNLNKRWIEERRNERQLRHKHI